MHRTVFRTPQTIVIGDVVAGRSLLYGRKLGQAVGMWAPSTPWALIEAGIVHVGFKGFYVGEEAKERVEASDLSRGGALFLVREVNPYPEHPLVWVRVTRLHGDITQTSAELGSEDVWFEMSTNLHYGVPKIELVGVCEAAANLNVGDSVPFARTDC